MQQTNPKIIKERQQKYQKLIRMIKGFQRSHEELRMLQKIKSDTVFEISLRFMKCQANKTYKFPKNDAATDSQSDSQDLEQLNYNKELVYSLHSQNKVKNEPSRDRSKIRMLDLEETSKRQKTQTTTLTSNRVYSLGNEKHRYSRQRIDRIEKLHKWAAERERQNTERASERRYKQSHESSLTKIPHAMYKYSPHRKSLIKSQNQSNNPSSHISQAKLVIATKVKEICKTEISPVKFERSRPKIKLITEENQSTIKRVSSKKLYTEEGDTARKGRMHNFLSNEIKKIEKTNILASITAPKSKQPKNIFHKQIY